MIRKETGTVLLPDCRAYELVSAANAGGYDVTSDLVPGQVPLPVKPRAEDSVLYSLSYGKVPGVGGEPTNHGNDPYVASRTSGRLVDDIRRHRGRGTTVPGPVRIDAPRRVG